MILFQLWNIRFASIRSESRVIVFEKLAISSTGRQGLRILCICDDHERRRNTQEETVNTVIPVSSVLGNVLIANGWLLSSCKDPIKFHFLWFLPCLGVIVPSYLGTYVCEVMHVLASSLDALDFIHQSLGPVVIR